MDTVSKIWAVSSGEYSDYQVNAIFSTKERAEAYLSLVYGDEYSDARVEEFPLNPDDPVTITDGLFPYLFHWSRTDRTKTVGTTDDVAPETPRTSASRMTLFEAFNFDPHREGLITAITYGWKHGPNQDQSVNFRITAHVMARDKAHAIKIGADRIREVLAGQRPVMVEDGQACLYQGLIPEDARDERNRPYKKYEHVFKPVPETVT